MAETRPFRGVFYRVPEADLPKILAPPYDAIGPALQEALHARHDRNVVRLEKNRSPGAEGYREAGETYRKWLAEGVLSADPNPALYLLEQSFALGERHLRRYGLLARFRAEDFKTGAIVPHERVNVAPKEERWRLLAATRANFSPIFLLFRDTGEFSARVARVLSERPIINVVDEASVRHRVWRITEQSMVTAFQDVLRATRAYIADGHHRYLAALRCAEQYGAEGAWTFGYFTPAEAPGLVVLPFHRVLSRGPSIEEARRLLEGSFALQPQPTVAAAARAVADSTAPYAFSLVGPGGSGFLAEATSPNLAQVFPGSTRPSLRALDVTFLYSVLLPRFLAVSEDAVSVAPSVAAVEEALARGRGPALLMRGMPVRHVLDVADSGEALPPDSTQFYPKPPAGLVIHPLAV